MLADARFAIPPAVYHRFRYAPPALRAAMAVENSRREVCTVVEHPSVTAEHLRRFDGGKTPCTEGTRSGICKQIFEKFADCTTEMHDLTEREAFVKGFTLGAKIIIEVMTTGGDE